MINPRLYTSTGRAALNAIGLLMLMACRDHKLDGMSGADLNVYNHGPDAIVVVQVDGYGGPRANSYGGGGGYCCVMVPDVWKPGLSAQVTWTSDPNSWMKLSDMPDNYAKYYQRHGPITVPVERWEKGQGCGFDVHIFPCDKVRIVRSCRAPETGEYPVPPDPDYIQKGQKILIDHIKENIVCPMPQTAR
ncbi:DUF3304 domain-containing protein [Silvania hatchlandensis]|uniref:DUF3304 domain-containing protein n=1 Tax=Silvania hatchlandensis TaxID=2926469 RepID=A0A9J6Q7G7_9ENTR|nr:DUF3304 domain-containing protein [Silvania hatchlandensis]MCU6666163.1 DUF3304 domain-containing protein [Silvania hatchlandensis]